MKLKDINEIKEDGLVVFMPSGIQATLFNEGKKILVKYYNLKEDRYTIKDFKKVMAEGIEVFSDQPTIPQQSVLMESYGWSIPELELGDSGFDSPEEAYQNAKMCLEDNNYEVGDFDGEGCSVYDPGDEEMGFLPFDGYCVIESDGEDDMDWEDEDDMDESILDKLSKKGFIRESLSKQLKENNWQNLGTPYYVAGENGFVEGPFDTYQQAEEFIDSLENPEDYSIIGEEEYENEFNEAYENVKNPEGTVFKALKDKKKEYITPEFKLEMLNCLDKIAREYPDIKIRQQALTFMDEINMQEYWDTKAVQDFIKKPLEMLNAHVNESLNEELQYGVEYRNMHDGIHRLLVTDSKEKAEQILAYLKELENPDTTVYDDNEIMDNSYFTWDEINKLADDCFEVDYREIEEGDGNYNGIYVINYNDIKPDIYESLNGEDEFDSIDIQNKMNEIADTLSKMGWTKVDATIQADAGLVLKKNNLELSLTLMDDGKIFIQYDYPEQKEKNLNKTDFMHNIYKILSDLDVEFLGITESLNEYYYTNQDYETDLKDNGKKLRKEADKLHYTDEKDELDAIAYNVKKIAKQIDKDSDKFLDAAFEESLNEDENSMAEEIRRGNKSGQDPKFGNWLLETSLDEKWEQLTNDMKLYLMDGIADFVQQGSLKEQDLLLEIDPECGLTKEDIQSLEMFDQEEIDYTFSSEDLQLNAYISYEIKTDLDTPKDMEESLEEDSDLGLYIQTTGELYKKHIQDKKDVDWDALINDGIAMYKEEVENKEFSPEEKEEAKEYLKNYFTESVNEDIYLKKENGEEVGPFEDQEAEEQYIKDQKDNGNEEEYEEIIKDENMSKKNEDCYKVYSTIDPDSQPLSFNNWNEVEDHLNKEWGDYKASMAKENAEFGTEEDKDAFMGNFEVAIEPIEIPVEEIPAEGIELEAEPVIEPTKEVCPECGETECICGQEECEDCCPECGKNPCECETEESIDDLEEDFEDEHIGKSEEPIEEPEQEETEEEINTPEEAAEKVDEIDDALDSLEDFLNTLIGDEELTPEEEQEIQEMCMAKLPDPKTVKEKDKKEKEEEKNEEFSDNMGMLTDINDLDFPDALADAVDTKEDGSLYRISDLAKELEDVKSTIEQLKNDFKSELTTMLQDLKNDLKLSVNNVETKVQDTKSAVDNLTSEEEDLADIEFDQEEAPVEEEGQEEAPEEAPAEEETEEDMEEAFDEASLKGNPIYENIKTIVNSNTKCNGKISIPTIAERLREDYGVNTKIGAVYQNVSEICRRTSIKECIIDVVQEKQLLKESMLGKAAKWLGGGLMSRLEQQKVQAQYENLEAVKQQIDKELQGGADAEQLKDTITLASEDENEEKQAKEYAIQKLQQKTPTTESILSKLKATTKTAQLRDLNIRG